jgi:hypothetical protein
VENSPMIMDYWKDKFEASKNWIEVLGQKCEFALCQRCLQELGCLMSLCKIISLKPLEFTNFCEVGHRWLHLDCDSFPLLPQNCLSLKGLLWRFCQLTILVKETPSLQEQLFPDVFHVRRKASSRSGENQG